ncbi:hypothetical protein KIN20_005990 [Parelaphostrongylus tenuis]|uniref:Uncharacterized protein n=1 Tax=Parelaphostrongylus tenuis TaxID=148309 RepID=A0AAD5QJ13_PARTN|nr:hypothetical protein KIN20_005990 [Parelaphostrongylus tenuis]
MENTFMQRERPSYSRVPRLVHVVSWGLKKKKTNTVKLKTRNNHRGELVKTDVATFANRAVRILTSGSFGSHFFAASAAVGGS